jgi:2-keto-4-pentenoate hydratase/2-oxohepta-3-ene-1,7-dioic acid hydratase in catechol pathway
MKIVRFQIADGSIYFGELRDETICEIINFSFQQTKYDFGRVIPISETKLLAPVTPKKVVGLAYNYKDLVGEKDKYDEPLIFLKSPESVIGPNDTIRIHNGSITWAEVELAIVIGKECSNVPIETASEYIYGYTIGNDVTMSNVHKRDHHLARSKALDTFCPIGPYIETSLLVDNLSLQHYINDELFQRGNTNNRILNDSESVSLVSQFIKLKPGDVILTGTPANAMNSLINNGDKIVMEITNLGKLTNQVQFK